MKTFCWLGWYEPISVSPPMPASAPWPKRGQGRGGDERAQHRVPADRAECHHHADARAERELAAQEGEAARPLVGLGAVGGGRAAHRRGDPAAAEPQPVVRAHRRGLGREAGAVQGGEEHVAAAIAGEDPPGAVGAVGRGGEADHQQPRVGVAEPGHRPRPVLLVGEGPAPHPADLLPPGHQAGARPAGDDLRRQVVEAHDVPRCAARKSAVSSMTAGSCWRLPCPPPRAMRSRIGCGVIPARASVPAQGTLASPVACQ